MSQRVAPFYIFLFIILISTNALSGRPKKNAFVPEDEYANQKNKNGIHLKEITKDFEKKFKLVSVHYREDKNEIRMIYANELGLKGLNSGKNAYEDGAVFYKAVYPASHDPMFEPSLVPEVAKLYQIMLYDKQKFKDYGGWGYAVFNEDAVTLPGDPEQTNHTCYACHKLAEQRGFVFSTQMWGLSPWVKAPANYIPAGKEKDAVAAKLESSLFKFSTAEFKNLNPEVRRILRTTSAKVNLMTGKMMDENFTGYVPELNSFLIKETVKTGSPSVAVKEVSGETLVSYAYIDAETAGVCDKKELLVRYGSARLTLKQHARNTQFEFFKCKESTGP